MKRATVLIATAVFSLTSQAHALSKAEVPEPLQPWIEWVLKDHEEELCPFLCQWSSPIILSLEEQKGSFSIQWRVFEEGWVSLPGDEEHWPLEVKADGKPLPVIMAEGGPQAYLEKGEYAITGGFLWDSLPPSLGLPREIGVVRLSVRGTPLERFTRDEDGRLWLKAQMQVSGEEERLEVRVHRMMTDDIPFLLTTRISLDVSGKTREVVFPPPLPAGFVPMELASPLPVEIQGDGRLKVQLKSGQWSITLKGRHEGPVSSIAAPAVQAPWPPPWPEEEIWVFEARHDLRLVSLKGVPSVDPQQTTLPDEWKNLPAYRIRPGEAIAFEEQRRGDSEPAPDQLSLYRDIWLDFNGRGYTFRDQITGTVVRSSRLEMNPPIRLGRVSVDGTDRLITTLGEKSAGVEIRQGRLDVNAESRMEGRRNPLPAVGWKHDFRSVSQVLHLPAGWRLFAVIGADQARETWLNQWTLLEIFMVLIFSLSFAKLWGRRWGLLSLATLMLTFPEMRGPEWIWLSVLLGHALLRLVHQGKLRSLIRLYKDGSLVALLVFSVPFMIDQVRSGLYPSLETVPIGPIAPVMKKEVMAPPVPPSAAPLEEQMAADIMVSSGMVAQEAQKRMPLRKAKAVQYQENLPGAKVQTGPGLPRWSWRDVRIEWKGPVEKGEKLRLYYLPPPLNLLLSFVRVLLLALLVLCVFQVPSGRLPSFLRRLFSRSAVAALLLLSLGFFTSTFAAEFPPPDVLTELQKRLLEKPPCDPDCGTISRMRIETTATTLTARLEIHLEAPNAVPLPGIAKEWSPQTVAVDGKKFAGLSRTEDGRLWIQLDAGVHQVTLSGPLPDRQTIQIPLPLKPRYVEAKTAGWVLEGLHEDGIADDNLRLIRTETAAPETMAAKGEAGPLPPFVRIERRLVLGLTWEVETKVVRVTPTGTGIVLEIPLLLGESVTTPGLRVEKGAALVNLAPQATDYSWRSILLESPTIELKAGDSASWTEVWQIEASPIWHIETEGTPMVHQFDAYGTWLPEWRPWPGEEVKIVVFRPEALEGETLTIEHSRLILNPGFRVTEVSLALDLRSSLGGQHPIELPDKAELQSVSIGGAVQPIRQVGRTVTLPITPGAQEFELRWNQPGGIGFFFRTPPVKLGLKSVNADLEIQLPPRWVLFTCGPRLGPAVLFWSLAVVILLASIVLGKISITPLKVYHWFLLGVGLTQAPVWSALIVAGWLLALGWRRDHVQEGKLAFNLTQILLALLTLTALVFLFFSIQKGLLGVPEMQIAGNGSHASLLKWFQDRNAEILPRPWVISLPMFAYRIAMLAWALWIAFALLKWLKWGWECFSTSGVWRPFRLVRKN